MPSRRYGLYNLVSSITDAGVPAYWKSLVNGADAEKAYAGFLEEDAGTISELKVMRIINELAVVVITYGLTRRAMESAIS